MLRTPCPSCCSAHYDTLKGEYPVGACDWCGGRGWIVTPPPTDRVTFVFTPTTPRGGVLWETFWGGKKLFETPNRDTLSVFTEITSCDWEDGAVKAAYDLATKTITWEMPS